MLFKFIPHLTYDDVLLFRDTFQFNQFFHGHINACVKLAARFCHNHVRDKLKKKRVSTRWHDGKLAHYVHVLLKICIIETTIERIYLLAIC